MLVGKDFEGIVDYYKRLNDECLISLCVFYGILDENFLIKLKEVGVKRYYYNVEMLKNYYNKICIIYIYEDRINIINIVKKVGFEICLGGIIGLGECREDRVDMVIELEKLEVFLIFINILMFIKGILFEN